MRFFVTRNPTFNSLTLDPQNPGPWQARISELSLRQDVNRTDLTAFARNGGKILMAHGTSDQLVSTRATAEYYERVRRDMGPGKTKHFLRYEIPGYGHAASTVFNAAWDSLSALEDWVEQGRPPRRSLPTASACPAAPARCASTPAGRSTSARATSMPPRASSACRAARAPASI